LNIQVWQSTGKEVLDPDDVCIASWKVCNLMSLMGQGGAWVVSDPAEQKISLRLSINFQCIKMSLDNVDIGNTSGRLFLDIIEALDLEAVDSGGTSDPYCAISLNHKLVAKTQVHKKTLQAQFNESFEIKIESRRRALLQIEVRDYNMLQKHVVLGSVQLHLSGIQEGEEFTDIFHLDGARKGSLKLRMLFQPEDMATLASVKTVTRSRDSVAEKRRDSIVDKKRDAIGRTDNVKEQTIVETDTARDASLESGRSSKLKVKQFTGLNPSSSTEVIQTGIFCFCLIHVVHYGSMKLHILEARNLKAADSNGLSDPYVKVVQIKHGKQKSLYKTSVVKKTLNPVFKDEKVTVEFPPEDILLVIKDHNLVGSSVEIGEAHFNVAEEIAKQLTPEMTLPFKFLFDRWIVIGLGGQGELHVSGEITVEKTSEDDELRRRQSTGASAMSSSSLHSASSKLEKPSGIKRLFSKSKDLNE
jgi:Ca2+-dependent lipid-binding protein